MWCEKFQIPSAKFQTFCNHKITQISTRNLFLEEKRDQKNLFVFLLAQVDIGINRI
jgi:hypothetical protein